MKVYIVTEGCYSDYRIMAVCLNEAIAEKIAKLSDSSQIEEWESDTYDSVHYDYNYYEVFGGVKGELKVNLERVDHPFYFDIGSFLNPCLYLFKWKGFARDEEHALKIAYDERAKKIAEREDL